MPLIFAGYIVFFAKLLLHPFYVSVGEVYYNPDTKGLEITLKIFIDDLEKAIIQEVDPDFEFSAKEMDANNEQNIDAYLQDKITINIDGNATSLKFIGYQLESDAVLCFIEGTKIKDIKHFEIQYTALFEVYQEQINLIHFQYKDEMKSFKLSNEEKSGSVDTSNW